MLSGALAASSLWVNGAHAYGGRGVVTALDSGSGNVFYDDLLARSKANGSVPSVGNSSPNPPREDQAAGTVVGRRCGPECQRAKKR